jgi:hypothetical protein
VALRVYLNDEMLNLDQAVTIVCNGVQVFNDKVQRKVATMMQSLAERGDPDYVFAAVVKKKGRLPILFSTIVAALWDKLKTPTSLLVR